MKSIHIYIEGKKKLKATISLPESWNEVPAELYPHLASLYLADESKMDKWDKTVRVFTILAWNHWKVICQLNDEELYTLLPSVDWVFNQLDLTVNHQPQLCTGENIFKGPANGLENLRFGEWCMADTYAAAFSQSGELSNLSKLVATLYRPVGKGNEYNADHESYRGDDREKFNDNVVDRRAELISKLPLYDLQGVYVWFASCRKQIINAYPSIFPSPVEPKTANEQEQANNGSGWLHIYDDLRGDPKFGGPERLEEEFLHTVLFSLERNHEKMKQLKSKYNL